MFETASSSYVPQESRGNGISYAAAAPPPPEKAAPIARATEALERELHRLHAALEALEHRLDPLLGPTGPTASSDSAKELATSAVASKLRELVLMTAHGRERVDRLLQRLEL